MEINTIIKNMKPPTPSKEKSKPGEIFNQYALEDPRENF
jgi:hypothetical protein